MVWPRFILTGVLLGALAVVPASRAQDRTVVPLIPTSDWRLTKTSMPDISTISGFPLDRAVEREYGVQKLELRRYQLDARKAEALLEEASDATAAYGLLTYYRIEGWTPEKGLDMAFIGPSGSSMVRGRVCIRVRPLEGFELSRNDFRALLIAIGGAHLAREEEGYFPPPLPTEGLIPHSEKYVTGLETARRVLPNFRTDLIGFAQGAEARVASYTTREGVATLVALIYPTPQIARVRYKAMESFLRINTENGPGAIYGKRGGSYIFLVLNTNNSEAEKLLEQFQVTSNVSWNERAPEQERFVMDLARMILSIIFLVILIAVIAVIAGFSVAMSRRVARRFFPDSNWANPERERVIRLNLR